MSMSYDNRPFEIQSKIRQLRNVCPYPLSWYESKSNKEIEGIWRSNVNKIVAAAIAYDEMIVRQRAGLPV